MYWPAFTSIVILVADAATIVRALLRPHREPASRLAWIIAILALPIAGVILYLLLGETRMGPRRAAGGKDAIAALRRPPGNRDIDPDQAGRAHWAPFALARTVN